VKVVEDKNEYSLLWREVKVKDDRRKEANKLEL
jgi:hypothetical protein